MGGRVHEGALIVQGKLQTHQGLFQTRPLPKDVHEKTLEVWLRMAQLEQCCGAVIMVRSADGDVFDSISIGERGTSQWIAGSEDGSRTRGLGGDAEHSATDWVHLAASYYRNGTIALYRNGIQYGDSYDAGALASFKSAEGAYVQLGRGIQGQQQQFTGDIDLARLYDQALDADQIVESFRAGRGQGCQITQPRCMMGTQYQGVFEDLSSSVPGNPLEEEAKCLSRAMYYHRWCMLSENEQTFAEYKPTGSRVGWPKGEYKRHIMSRGQHKLQLHLASKPPVCYTNDVGCKQAAAAATEVCSSMHRCAGFSVHQGQKAELFKLPVLQKYDLNSTDDDASDTSWDTYLKPKPSGCWITQPVCEVSTYYMGYFRDDGDGEAALQRTLEHNKTACLERAKHWHLFCKAPSADSTVAEFLPSGAIGSYPHEMYTRSANAIGPVRTTLRRQGVKCTDKLSCILNLNGFVTLDTTVTGSLSVPTV